MQTIDTLARILDVSEFEIFERAYERWYGRRPELAQLKKEFARYLYRHELPLYVQDFVRNEHVLLA